MCYELAEKYPHTKSNTQSEKYLIIKNIVNTFDEMIVIKHTCSLGLRDGAPRKMSKK